MDLRKQTLLFIVVAGFAAYLLGAALSAIFIVALPMSHNWCSEWNDYPELSTPGDCLVFADPFEQAKYDHNARMIGRNKYLVSFQFFFWMFVAGVAFHWLPKLRGLEVSRLRTDTEKLAALAILAFMVAVIVPLVLGALLPPPVDWFPRILRDIHDAQVEAELRLLQALH